VPLFGRPAVTNAFQAVLFGDGNPLGFAPGTIVFDYGLLEGTGGTCDNDCGNGGWADSIGTATIGLNLGDGVNYATLNSLGIGDAGGLITPADFPALENPTLDPFLFTPDGNGDYAVSAIPYSLLPSLLGFTQNTVPEPPVWVLMAIGLAALIGKRRIARDY
jgi:hypothetical protein